MRKKWVAMGVGFGIGAAMLLVSGFSAMADTSGYDAYKMALKNLKAEKSLTANVEWKVTDNGTKVFAGTANMKMNHEQNTGSVAASFGDSSGMHSLNVFRQDSKVIIKSSEDDVYRVMERNGPKWKHGGEMQGPPKAVEKVFDTLMGDVRELATVESESDGGKKATLELSGSQIPAVVNALGTLIVSKDASGEQWGHEKWDHDASPKLEKKVNLPKLTDNIKVEQLNLIAKINPNNVLEEQTAEIHIFGKDESGKDHKLAAQIHVDFTDFNQTVPEQVDLTGKQTVEMQNDRVKWGWNHE